MKLPIPQCSWVGDVVMQTTYPDKIVGYDVTHPDGSVERFSADEWLVAFFSEEGGVKYYLIPDTPFDDGYHIAQNVASGEISRPDDWIEITSAKPLTLPGEEEVVRQACARWEGHPGKHGYTLKRRLRVWMRCEHPWLWRLIWGRKGQR